MNEIYNKLLECINKNREGFDTVVKADQLDEEGITSEEIINFLEYSINEDYLKKEIKNSILISDGDILGTLKIIHDLAFEEGKYILFINEENMSTNYYLINMVNIIYRKLNLNVQIKLDLNINYNRYMDKNVTLIGNEIFINEAKDDFNNPDIIIM